MLTWVDTLTAQYTKGKSELEAYRKQIDRKDPQGKFEVTVVGGMISDMQYALEWMRKGRRPGSRRGIENSQVYLRHDFMDMDEFPSLDLEISESSLTDPQKKRILEILLQLSERERQCYILHLAYGRSMAEISVDLGLTKRTVQTFIDRAKAKIQKFIA
ncbi:sigma factor-like helix-turn-helix DNA-binding protein [Paenibacillus oryzisoli]|uniref:RNA polymerase sigma factor 70 region 4 type 2 domain-containing protein n=1 Tax=Paenibacillus oryzisoli TaxID=1850517 RepID=A0A198AJA0_9BACL|nr:sigma factor-like helix-turn-helix DNA-binding protein [Paenibacillus oryzisoli]OAS21150.1 hypothetical protein A8708_30125 [Paenibacillus oryzisoli]